jgi:hypothetical protein
VYTTKTWVWDSLENKRFILNFVFDKHSWFVWTVVYGLWEYRWLIDQQTIMLKLSRKKIKLSSYRSISLTTAWFQWGFEKQGTFQTSIYGFWLPCGINIKHTSGVFAVIYLIIIFVVLGLIPTITYFYHCHISFLLKY